MGRDLDYKAILDAIPNIIFHVNKDGTYLWYKGAIDELYATPVKILGKKIVDNMPPKLVEQTMQKITETLETGEQQYFEFQIEKNGEKNFFDCRMVKYREGEVLAIVQNITDFKRVEKKKQEKDATLSLVQEIAHIGIWEWNILNDKFYISEEMHWIFDIDEKEFQFQVSKLPNILEKLIHPDDIQKVKSSMSRAVQSGTGESIEFRIVRFDGNVRWIRGDGIFIYDEKGNRFKMIGFVQDITQRKQIEEVLEKQKTELSDFAHFMAHDIRNSLTTIEGYADLLENAQDKSYLEIIVDQTRTIKRLLDRSLELADAGLTIDKNENVDLNKIVDDIARVTIPDSVEFSHNILPTVQGDDEKLYQVFKNIIENALKHGSPSKIEVKARKTKKSNSILICNDGKSIPQKNHNKIFERGYTTTPKSKGLGLTIVKKLVEAHGWKINLISKPKNTIFRISLPKK
ncbi:MAG: PAS domain-containing sensor histidine kinase [Candidatus Hodarchaeales archaeon]|jgi:PAS domain S-box-containing protein